MTEDEHVYLSTACHHELHEECRKECKFCEVSCVCDCHVEVSADKLAGLTEQYAAILKSYEAIQANYADVADDIVKIKTALNIDVLPSGG